MIAVVGLGFVGLATALVFADKGFRVVGYDIDAARMSMLANRVVPFHEPELDRVLSRRLGHTFLLAESIAAAVENAEIVFFCVGTPQGTDGAVDLSHLLGALEALLQVIDKDQFRVLVIKSTVPPGTTAEKVAPVLRARGWQIGKDIGLANNPEFLREGKAWEDVVRPDRIVLGTEDGRSSEILRRLHADFGAPVVMVSWNTGEFIKYLSNALLATMVSFSNDAAMIADAVGGIDVKKAFDVLHLDRRWYGQPANMATYVYPGCGFGGYCLPKDVAALRAQALSKGYDSPILAATLSINERIRDFVVGKALSHATADRPIGVLGLAFKPGSDDVRDTSAKAVIEGLIAAGARVLAYDPLAVANFRALYGGAGSRLHDVSYADSLERLVAAADPLVILTGWPEFKERRDLYSARTVLDFRHIL